MDIDDYIIKSNPLDDIISRSYRSINKRKDEIIKQAIISHTGDLDLDDVREHGICIKTSDNKEETYYYDKMPLVTFYNHEGNIDGNHLKLSIEYNVHIK